MKAWRRASTYPRPSHPLVNTPTVGVSAHERLSEMLGVHVREHERILLASFPPRCGSARCCDRGTVGDATHRSGTHAHLARHARLCHRTLDGRGRRRHGEVVVKRRLREEGVREAKQLLKKLYATTDRSPLLVNWTFNSPSPRRSSIMRMYSSACRATSGTRRRRPGVGDVADAAVAARVEYSEAHHPRSKYRVEHVAPRGFPAGEVARRLRQDDHVTLEVGIQARHLPHRKTETIRLSSVRSACGSCIVVYSARIWK